MSVMTVHLRMLDKFKKTKFSHFVIEKVPMFQYPEEVKDYLVETIRMPYNQPSEVNWDTYWKAGETKSLTSSTKRHYSKLL